jgi:predicted small metal-binding protein
MAGFAPRLRFECLETGCDAIIEAITEEELLDTVHRHMADDHGTFELEDVILDNATRLD